MRKILLNANLYHLRSEPEGIRLESSLVVIEENRIRAYGIEEGGREGISV